MDSPGVVQDVLSQSSSQTATQQQYVRPSGVFSQSLGFPRYRRKELAAHMMEEVVTEVMDRVKVNAILKDCQPKIRRYLLERLRGEEDRRRMLEKQRSQQEAWKERWRKLEEEVTKELDALREYEHLLGDEELEGSVEDDLMVTDDMERCIWSSWRLQRCTRRWRWMWRREST